ncbi:alcaligin biosynthesis protein [Zobellella denitrificans]|uniref:lysine N(6)-hydroxylase/L-ornithine N(5)-oxygenase family protein n=1 Tax=Zobellella denitrificans TaxID=347534 RepID=UPI000B8C69AA|nr:lysine N(6)-hydroxylase/L-ornithine N(5)-oxygenase family protein [Zobellella denitrificans]OXS15421.1 alcaligin biosynthesis protein [Zobellella denitrificans]
MNDSIHDFAAIGIGPFNLGLACLTAPIAGLKGIFLDQKPGFDWHPGMLLEDATLQTPFMADLVTLADPTSPFSFLNYIKEQGRIYSFYIREDFFLLRNEYNQYCQWAVSRLPNLRFNTRVEHIEYLEPQRCYRIRATDRQSGDALSFLARKLVLGTGTRPYLPECCREVEGPVIHSAHYLQNKAELQQREAITVVGSGQSAAEIFRDLLQDIDGRGYQLSWITRSPRFFPLEYTKLTLEMTSPEYVDYFHALPPHQRDSLLQSQKGLYKGINASLIDDIYDLLYQKRLLADIRVQLHTNSELKAVTPVDGDLALTLRQTEQGVDYRHRTQALVLATGYRPCLPEFVQGIARRIRWDGCGRFDVARNYSIDHGGNQIFVQNAESHTHGLVTPDLGMACYRNSWLIRELTGQEHYPVERRIAFQQFAAPTAAVPEREAITL